MRCALLGMRDSLRQASLIPTEPLGLFACFTAEEEAAAFLYFALRQKGYEVPDYQKLRRHPDKIRMLVFAQVVFQYFFNRLPAGVVNTVRIEREGDRPKTSRHIKFNEHQLYLVQDDPLETVSTLGNGQDPHQAAISEIIDDTLTELVPAGFTLKSYVDKNLANRRNLSIYGDPDRKPRLASQEGISLFTETCIGIVVLGFLVFNGTSRTASLEKIVKDVFSRM